MTDKLPKGWKLAEPTQGQLEAFERDFQERESKGRGNYNGAIVRAALDAGWFDQTPDETDVAVMKPGVVSALARAVDAAYAACLTIPENLS